MVNKLILDKLPELLYNYIVRSSIYMKIKNIILTIVCMVFSTTAFAVEQTWEGSVGWEGFTITTGENTVVDLEYQYTVPGYAVSGGVHYQRTDDDDNIVGVMSTAEHGSFSLKVVGDWNITDEDITSSLKGRYGLASLGVGAYVRGNMDIDDFDYTGTDFGADYSFKVTNRVAIGIDYKIPYGGLFKWISCPNYFGEIIEWIGWAIATWSLAGLAFAVWALANLVPRSQSNHQWYIKYFEEYPKDRKILIPKIW